MALAAKGLQITQIVTAAQIKRLAVVAFQMKLRAAFRAFVVIAA
jgi:hypothetical protein